MRRAFLFSLFALLLGFLGNAHAHKPSDAYLSLKVDGKHLDGQWDIALRDLDHALGIDRDGDGALTWDEIRSRHEAIAAYAMARLDLSSEGAACPAAVRRHLIDSHSDGAYAVLKFEAECAAPITALAIGYRLLFELDPQHKGLLKLDGGGRTSTAIFSAEQPLQTLAPAQAGRLRQFADYLRHGVRHIWIGFDHILFLLSLLLPAVLVYRERQWRAGAGFREALLDVMKIVTAFTLAHSLTLSLAALGVVALPSRWVESAIAASVVLAALNNVFPLFGGRRWPAALGFGLIHGFGFAGVLSDLGLPQASLLQALIGFNLGVELGQAAIVAVFLPLAYLIRETLFYRRLVLRGGSLAIVLISGVWLAERALDLKLVSA
jgi:hypothetical protein